MLKKEGTNKNAANKPLRSDDILGALGVLLRAIQEQNARQEAMRIMLVKAGIFSDEAFDAEVALARVALHDALQQKVNLELSDESHAALRRLLDAYEGKPQ